MKKLLIPWLVFASSLIEDQAATLNHGALAVDLAAAEERCYKANSIQERDSNGI
jgi:hypothetical protein